MFTTSQLQELKRRYASMYIKEESLDEHCGVCDEQGIEETIDYKYDGKVVKISKKNFSKVHKDFKNSTKGKEMMMINDPKTGGSISVPVQFEEVQLEEVELDEELETIYSNLQEIYENLDEDEQDDFDAILELHEEGEITDEELVEGLADYLTKSGRAKKKLARLQKKTAKMQSKIAAKKKKRSDDLSVKRKIRGEKSKQRKIKAKAKADKKANPSKLRKGLKKVGGALKKVFGKSESVDESQELQAIMALDDAGIKASINRKDQVVVKKKDLKKAEKALKKSFRKGGAPELHAEEVEVNENLVSQGKKALEKAGIKVRQKDTKLFVAKKDRKKAGEILIKTIHRDAWFSDDAPMLRNEEVEIDEATAYPATIKTLRMIVKDKQHQMVMFKSGKAIVDLFTANAMVQVYDAMKKPEIKKKFEMMIADKAGFLKTQEFAMKMLSRGR